MFKNSFKKIVAGSIGAGAAMVAFSGIASAASADELRPGCEWDASGNKVQRCQVYSEAFGKNMTVQIRASNTDKAIYLLDGARAGNHANAWTIDVPAAEIYGEDDATVVMPVGGAGSWYADWDRQSVNQEERQMWETFVSKELPAYNAQHFGTSNKNAIAGLSMSGGSAVNIAQKNPETFQAAGSFSGYYQTTAPGSFEVIDIVNRDIGVGRAYDIHGPAFSPGWYASDPSHPANMGPMGNNGVKMFGTVGNALEDPFSPNAHASIGLEAASIASTRVLQVNSFLFGHSAEFYDVAGGHNWSTFGDGLRVTKDPILAHLDNTPQHLSADVPLEAEVGTIDSSVVGEVDYLPEPVQEVENIVEEAFVGSSEQNDELYDVWTKVKELVHNIFNPDKIGIPVEDA